MEVSVSRLSTVRTPDVTGAPWRPLPALYLKASGATPCLSLFFLVFQKGPQAPARAVTVPGESRPPWLRAPRAPRPGCLPSQRASETGTAPRVLGSDAKIELEEFTSRLQTELKPASQPYSGCPFLKPPQQESNQHRGILLPLWLGQLSGDTPLLTAPAPLWGAQRAARRDASRISVAAMVRVERSIWNRLQC
ncbi:transcription initiation factor TFIID subunit 4-like protein [Lates japonicus]|uniref:Transcription initiation factor TFIID subunit 4-like protein n=1 Tax=Lates japonicus TaxID=270547 RepID=A0AAD3MM05_LATJO|nr:transcription initiation factor TFIID subunit 4-like protein [Lates japonicus]